MSCASTMRYYQGRDDFNFLKSSRVRLGFYDGAVTLEVGGDGSRGEACAGMFVAFSAPRISL